MTTRRRRPLVLVLAVYVLGAFVGTIAGAIIGAILGGRAAAWWL